MFNALLNKDDPDYLIEDFWLGLKQNMTNFYNDKNIVSLSRCVNSWSTRLNLLKQKKQYELIEKLIYNYLSLYGIDVLRSGNMYYLGLLNTNIKRWDKICSQSYITGYQNCMIMLLEISYKLYYKSKNENELNEIKNLFRDIELYLMYDDFQLLIEYSIKYKKTSIIDTLIKYNSNKIYKDISSIIGKNVNGLSGKKILGLLN